MIDIYFLIPAVNRKMCDSTAELAIPTWIPTNVTNAETEAHPQTAKTKTRKCSK